MAKNKQIMDSDGLKLGGQNTALKGIKVFGIKADIKGMAKASKGKHE